MTGVNPTICAATDALTIRAGRWYCQPRMHTIADASDGDVARAVAARMPGSAEAAEGELYRRFAGRVRLYGLRHLRDEDAARDLVQHVMLITIEKLRDGSVRDAEQIASFILGVSRTASIDLKRRERRRERLRETFIDARAFEMPASETTVDVDRLEACLAQLGERERTVVLLTFYAERTADEVAKELGASSGNVRVIRHRAIARLRKCVTSRETVS
jgi:RNA polymerase sigma-70 factor (ECF subfamily)